MVKPNGRETYLHLVLSHSYSNLMFDQYEIAKIFYSLVAKEYYGLIYAT